MYTTSFSGTYSASNPTISSVVNSVVGSPTAGGLVGGLYTVSNGLQTTLNAIATNSQTVANSISSFSGSIGSLQTTLNSFGNQISSYNDDLGSFLSTAQTATSMIPMVVQIFYGVSLGLAAFCLMGVVLMTFCDKYKCRYLMYFACLFMFFIGLLGFIIAVVFSAIIPVYYWGCVWISTTTSSQLGFNSKYLIIQLTFRPSSLIKTIEITLELVYLEEQETL